MFHMGSGELLLILLIALIFLGPSKLPELAKALGKSIREFQKAKDELHEDLQAPATKRAPQVQVQVTEVPPKVIEVASTATIVKEEKETVSTTQNIQ